MMKRRGPEGSKEVRESDVMCSLGMGAQALSGFGAGCPLRKEPDMRCLQPLA